MFLKKVWRYIKSLFGKNPYPKHTAEWWFYQADWPKEVKEKAIKNTKGGDRIHRSLKDALNRAFLWQKRPEGHDFWEEIYDSLPDENS